MKHRAVLLNGTNKGNLTHNLVFAIEKMTASNIEIVAKSSLFGSESWGFKSSDFINQAVVIESYYSAHELLFVLQKIEKLAGRETKATDQYEARSLDIDIIFFDNQIIETTDLIIPHPHMHKRRFVLEPLSEIIPEYIHPKLNQSINTLLLKCTDKGKVWRMG
jgi:2-amino-4-hydroxy-6-hydroxymethyldihydropteridine diphosphokinase